MTRVLNLVVFLLLLELVVGCDSVVGVEPNAASAIVEPGLKVHLFAPDTVAVRDSFVVRFVVQNRTFEDQTVVTPSTCLVIPGVFESSGLERVPFKGSIIGCGAAIWEHEIPRGKSVGRTFEMRAVLPQYEEGEEDKLVSPGRYAVRVKLDWTIAGESVELSAIERELVVRP